MNCLQFTTKDNFFTFFFFTSINFNHFSVWPNVAWNGHCTNRIRNLHSGILADWPNHWHTHHHTRVADLHCVYTVFWGESAVKCNGGFTPWTILRARGCISSLVSIDFTQSKQMDEELKRKEGKTVLWRWWQRQPTSGNRWCSCPHCSANADCCKEGGLWMCRAVELQFMNWKLWKHCHPRDGVSSTKDQDWPDWTLSFPFGNHWCHLSPWGRRRAAPAAAGARIQRFCRQKIMFLRACQAHCLSLSWARGRKWRDSKKGNEHCWFSSH